jgi:hypothetical protein
LFIFDRVILEELEVPRRQRVDRHPYAPLSVSSNGSRMPEVR